MGQPFDRLAAEGGVGGNHPPSVVDLTAAVGAVTFEGLGDHADLVCIQIRCDLQEDGGFFAVLLCQQLAPLRNRAQQRVQRLVTLQAAQVLGVGAGDVDGDVNGIGVDAGQAGQVVVDSALKRG